MAFSADLSVMYPTYVYVGSDGNYYLDFMDTQTDNWVDTEGVLYFDSGSGNYILDNNPNVVYDSNGNNIGTPSENGIDMSSGGTGAGSTGSTGLNSGSGGGFWGGLANTLLGQAGAITGALTGHNTTTSGHPVIPPANKPSVTMSSGTKTALWALGIIAVGATVYFIAKHKSK